MDGFPLAATDNLLWPAILYLDCNPQLITVVSPFLCAAALEWLIVNSPEARILPNLKANRAPTRSQNNFTEEIEMLVTKKMLMALTLVGALVGAGLGALVTRSAQSTSAANSGYENTATTNDRTQPVNYNDRAPEQLAA